MPRHILVAIDLLDKDCWAMLCPEVRDLAKPDTHLHLMHVVPEQKALSPLSQFIPEAFQDAHRAESHKALESLAEDLPKGTDVHFHLRSGNVYVEVLEAAIKIDADLIVVGSQSPDLRDYLLGPKAARIVRHAECSVLVVRDKGKA